MAHLTKRQTTLFKDYWSQPTKAATFFFVIIHILLVLFYFGPVGQADRDEVWRLSLLKFPPEHK